ncbi:hypothetical protein [Candidatus Sororendozoicomonas aggregata]|uniref:hypothetical protein n=1 Tax=Candidatus Sororendozoicomonas aggregata TaxID=3073239 RepID=UPI002ECFFEAE
MGGHHGKASVQRSISLNEIVAYYFSVKDIAADQTMNLGVKVPGDTQRINDVLDA